MFLNTMIAVGSDFAVWPPHYFKEKARRFARQKHGLATADTCLIHSPNTNDKSHVGQNELLEIVTGFQLVKIIDPVAHYAGKAASTILPYRRRDCVAEGNVVGNVAFQRHLDEKPARGVIL